MLRQACILVGGRGKRLGDLTNAIPKPLIEVGNNVPFLDFLIEQVARQGFDDIILLAGYLAHLVAERYHGRKMGSARVRVLVEEEPRGTAGALLSARYFVESRFLLLNGDSFFDTNLRSFAAQAVASEAQAFLALRQVGDGSRYGAVQLEENRIVRFREKDSTERGPALINAGIYVVASSLLNHISALPCSLESEIFPRLAAEGRLYGVTREGYFLDIGLRATLEKARRDLIGLRRRPAAFLDREGILNAGDHGYVPHPSRFEWRSDAQQAVRLLNDLGYRTIVISNEAGDGLDYYPEARTQAQHELIQARLAEVGAFVDAFYDCPCHPEAMIERFPTVHSDRKARVGMILRAMSEFDIDNSKSFLICDKPTDIEAAKIAGLHGFLYEGGDLAGFVERCIAAVAPGYLDRQFC
jgi:histidinol-phosphate phosphatase family protein